MPSIKSQNVGDNHLFWRSVGVGGHGSERRSPAEVAAKLENSFSLDNAVNGDMRFRDAQLGALYAILSRQFAGETSPKTIVMPTGSGKTETMLAAFAARPIQTLVIVPSDALRQQIANKFVTLGILPDCKIVSGDFLTPIVAILKSAISTEGDCDELLEHCNVVVATAAALAVQGKEFKEALFSRCQRLFIDEAHHVAARTWSEVVGRFRNKPVFQFTATPYREDRRRLSGEILYTYPLRKAQLDGIFARINYRSIFSDTKIDIAVAQAAIDQLASDREAELDHILMARVNSIVRAKEVVALYLTLAPEFAPVRLDSKMTPSERSDALTEVKQRRSRIIVCVDMLGEGFDMPQLKIAAIHDPHKSLSVTLQFIGRFTRTASEHLGAATIIVPREIIGIDERLQRLYAEDSDWNEVIQDLSDIEIATQKSRDDFDRGFDVSEMPMALRSVRPKMSTVVYRSNNLEWHPDGISEYVNLDGVLGGKAIVNDDEQVLWFIMEDRSSIDWGSFPDLEQTNYVLHVVHCDKSKNLLYINCSANSGVYNDLAQAIGGAGVTLVDGNETFRILSKLERRVAKNLGLLDAISHNRRFMFLVGGDTTEGFGPTAKQKSKTNLFASGFSNGVRASYGVSRKGRVWSHAAASDIYSWVEWAKGVGQYVTDETIDIDSVMSGFIKPVRLVERPKLVPLGVELAPSMLGSMANPATVVEGDHEFALYDADFTLASHSDNGPIIFNVVTDKGEYPFEIAFDSSGVSYKSLGTDPKTNRARIQSMLSVSLNEHGVIVHFEKEAVLSEDGELLQPDRESPRFSKDALQVGDWKGVDITKESQGSDRRKDTVQHRTIKILSEEEQWDIIMDDDGKGEVADIVFLRSSETEVHMLLGHCKFSGSPKPGCRLSDLYTVCGQAVKSHKAKSEFEAVLQKLLRREQGRRDRHGTTGFVKGNRKKLFELANRCRFLRPSVTVLIAQPGLSKAHINNPASELLGCTDHYLSDTCASNLRVLCSK